ncbi:UDP-glucosyltransferase 2-like [Cylas formicarius]|uniref:UDP-glucosyltransferase 2-like n=1 Tax=Cylas formicarius TaxID=197179 RepID=UPI00295841BB|nr:UDP-glucosyltransferase 2-like [Cylas formicarius]
MIIKELFIITSFLLAECLCARILAIASHPSYSHNLFFRPIWKKLADKGHDLTVLTTDPMESTYPRIREIDLHYVYEKKSQIRSLDWKSARWLTILQTYFRMFKEVAEAELDHPEVQSLLKNKSESFDLVICELHMPVMFGFAHRFGCPLIGISSTDVLTDQHSALGNPTHPLTFTDAFMPIRDLTFPSRTDAAFWMVYNYIRSCKEDYFLLGNLVEREKMQQYFGSDVPPPLTLLRNISLVFLNTHPLFDSRPLSPKFVRIGGGIPTRYPKPLPYEMSTFLDDNPQGVIYFSLGTTIMIEQYPEHFLNVTLETFKDLPYAVLWKFDHHIPGLPKNVRIFQWVPQRDLLAHRNVKVFLTQGGVHSIEEAIHAGVPMVGIPFVSDQARNVDNAVSKGIALCLDKNTITKRTLTRAIMEVVGNKQYRERIDAISRLIRDAPMDVLEKVVWWTEFVLRNPQVGSILQNGNLDVPLYQYFFLDVLAVLVCILMGLIILTRWMIFTFLRVVRLLTSWLVKKKVE